MKTNVGQHATQWQTVFADEEKIGLDMRLLIVLSTCSSVACLELETVHWKSMPLRIKLTFQTKITIRR